MIGNLGYKKPLIILAFDHRSTFATKMFGFSHLEQLKTSQIEEIINYKNIIYSGFRNAISKTIPKEVGAILVDEQFGDKILRDARQRGIISLLTTEKSGQEEFDFEYGKDFPTHIEKYKPTFVKALVRYNPNDDIDLKLRQKKKLKFLSDYCHKNGFKFLLEVLVLPTKEELLSLNNNRDKYDKALRPKETCGMIEELQKARIEPDIWKLEGMEDTKDYQMLVSKAQADGRHNVGIVILGRGENEGKVEEWVLAGGKVEGVVGFAVGRTIFWKTLIALRNGEVTRYEAINKISQNYQRLYKLFMKGRNS